MWKDEHEDRAERASQGTFRVFFCNEKLRPEIISRRLEIMRLRPEIMRLRPDVVKLQLDGVKIRIAV